MTPQYGELRSRAAEIGLGVWGTSTNFNGFRVLAALLHGTLVVGVSQTLRRWTEGTTYIWQGGHHVGQSMALAHISSIEYRCEDTVLSLYG